MKKKKPTKKDIEVVMSNVIMHLEGLQQKIEALDNLFGMYIKHKKDEKGFQKYIKKQIDLVSDDRVK